MMQSFATLPSLAGLGSLSLLTSAAICFSLSLLLIPILERHALVHPNSRSSHKKPTPQGGGIAVIAATTIVISAVSLFFPGFLGQPSNLFVVFASATVLGVIGMADDIRPLEAFPRLLLQAIAVIAILASLPPNLNILPAFPWWVERALMFVALLWFVNLANFMDGIDWMTVVEVVPVTLGLAICGLIGGLPPGATFVAFALCGAMIGFAPFNRPVARLFLGDVGSLPIGLLIGWMLILLAGSHLVPALLLPLYYLADATITVTRRAYSGERIMQAHRSHFYQRARDNGFSVYQIICRVLAANVCLLAFAIVAFMSPSAIVQLPALLAGGVITAALLWNFGHRREV